MKKRFLTGTALTFVLLCVLSIVVWAYGVDLSFPAARRFKVTQGYHTGHEAYDYGFPNHTQVIAAKAGQVTARTWQYADNWQSDCAGFVRDRGNYLILDHGGGAETRYYHLSNTGSQPGVGTSFDRGDSMALSDNTGCSTASHLHFQLLVNGSARDPYAGTGEWVAGSPLPMGYRDQNGTVHGPYAIDYPSFSTLWENLEGEPGSPLNDDGSTMVGQGNSEILYQNSQPFEHGTMTFETGSGVQYNPYTETYLPDIRADKNANGWKSIIVIRNNRNSQLKVNVTFYARNGFFTGSGQVLESRTYTALPARGVWVVDTRSVLLDYLNETYGLYPDVFEGSAIVYAGQDVSDVSVAVMNIQSYPYATGSYTGLTEASSTLYVPLLMKNNSNWNTDLTVFNVGTSSTQVSVQYVPAAGGGTGCTTNPQFIAANGSYQFNQRDNPGCTLSGTFIGGARVTNSGGQPLAVTANQWKDSSGVVSFMSYEGIPGGHTASFQPLLMRDNNSWYTGASFQDTAGSLGTVNARYFRQDSAKCGNSIFDLAANGITIRNPLPPTEACSSPSSFLGSGRSTRSNNLSLAVVVNQATTSNLNVMSYSAGGEGSTTVVVPRLMKNRDNWQGRNDWYGGLGVQNLGSSPATVNVSYYNTAMS
jgi:murein DD-endopeptidase MepM/ murein hydrolase activator NlpD